MLESLLEIVLESVSVNFEGKNSSFGRKPLILAKHIDAKNDTFNPTSRWILLILIKGGT